MSSFLKFLWRLFFNFTTLVTGGLLGLYYTLVAPSIENFRYKPLLDFGIPILGFLAACFLTWKNTYDESQRLLIQVAKLEDDQPKYKLRVINESHILAETLVEIAEDRAAAIKEKASVPKPSTWMPQIPTIFGGELTETDWEKYIEKLDDYKTYLEEIKAIEGYQIVNFELASYGRSDSNLNVTITFKNCEQVVDFYDKQLRNKYPDKPTRETLLAPLSNIHPIQRLGSRREIHTEEKDTLSVEYDIIRGGDKFRLHHNPIFIRPISDGPMQVAYSFKSDKLTQTADKVLTLR